MLLQIPSRSWATLYQNRNAGQDPEFSRCNTCGKMFQSEVFVRKHIVSKHPQILSGKKLIVRGGVVLWGVLGVGPPRFAP